MATNYREILRLVKRGYDTASIVDCKGSDTIADIFTSLFTSCGKPGSHPWQHPYHPLHFLSKLIN